MPAIRDSVIVITGASSGLGRAIALDLADRGANLVLAARRAEALEDTARACHSAGARAIAVPTDVTIEAEVDRLAAQAIETYGRIDVWINNAAVTLFAELDHAPFEEHWRVIETNLMGAMLGARAVVPHFRRQHHGVLINVSSVLGEVGHAFVPSYAISKFGVHGLSEALRVGLADEADIHVCTILPYALDTPHFEVAANRIARAPRALPPMQSPEKVAQAVARLIERPRRVKFVPRSLVLGLAFHRVMPRSAERLLRAALERWHISNDRARISQGNLFEPPAELARTHGERPPMIRTPLFVAWCAQKFVRIQLEAAAHRIRRIAARLRPHGHGERALRSA